MRRSPYSSFNLNITLFSAFYFRNAEISQIIKMITTTTAIIPTHTPALNIPSIALQLLRQIKIDTINVKCNFFMADILYFFDSPYNIQTVKKVL